MNADVSSGLLCINRDLLILSRTEKDVPLRCVVLCKVRKGE